MKKPLGLNQKVTLSFLSIFIITTIISSFIIYYKFSGTTQKITHGMEKAKTEIVSAQSMVDSLFPGEWQVRDGKLYKGSELVNENNALVDEISDKIKAQVTVFQGDTRVATTVKSNEDGRRVTGTKAPQQALDVLNSGADYSGIVKLVDGEYYTSAYKPIRNGSGQIIGMFFIGISINDMIKGEMSSALFWICGASFLMILLILPIIYFIIKRINAPIHEVKDLMKLAEDGDFTIQAKVSSQDEIGQLAISFNNMVEGQRRLISGVKGMFENVRTTLAQVNKAIEELASTSENQASFAEEFSQTIEEMDKAIKSVEQNILHMVNNIGQSTTSVEQMNQSIQEIASAAQETSMKAGEASFAMKEMDESIKEVSEASKTVNAEADNAVKKAQAGKSVVETAIDEMDNINEAIKDIAAKIKALGNNAEQAEEIINIINDIAEQTNLLALNASIEAARAGEHGKGFAVVANAIRELSEKSAVATKDISKLIETIQSGANAAIETTNEGAEKINTGIGLVKETGKTFEQIFEEINKTTTLIAQIAKSTEGQRIKSEAVTQAAGKINEYVLRLSATTQQQSAGSDEIVQAIESISKLAHEISAAAQQQAAQSEEIVKLSENVSAGAGEVSSTSEEIAAAADELMLQVEELERMISGFKI